MPITWYALRGLKGPSGHLPLGGIWKDTSALAIKPCGRNAGYWQGRKGQGFDMCRYTHAIIAHGKALAECLSRCRPFSEIVGHRTFNYLGD